jgi:hypothetical protein
MLMALLLIKKIDHCLTNPTKWPCPQSFDISMTTSVHSTDLKFCTCWRISVHLTLVNVFNDKVKFLPERGHEGTEREQRYSSTLYLTSALDGSGWSTPHPGRFTPSKEIRYPFYRRLGGPHGRSGRVRKTFSSLGFDAMNVHPVTSLYSSYGITVHVFKGHCKFKIPPSWAVVGI